MIKVSKKVEYALMALKWMAQKEAGALTSVREICQTFKIPFHTTSKVLQSLNHQNIAQSIQGIKGGYTLTKPLKEINFMELTQFIEKENKTSSFCSTSRGICQFYDSCHIKAPMQQLNEQIYQFLCHLNLEELLMDKKREKMSV